MFTQLISIVYNLCHNAFHSFIYAFHFFTDPCHLYSYLYFLGMHDWIDTVCRCCYCQLFGEQRHSIVNSRSETLVRFEKTFENCPATAFATATRWTKIPCICLRHNSAHCIQAMHSRCCVDQQHASINNCMLNICTKFAQLSI